MAKLTDKQVAANEAKQNRQKAGGNAKKSTAAVSLSVMLGQGTKVTLGDAEYELTRFSLSQMGRAGEFFALCPEALLFHAIAAAENPDGAYDYERTAQYLAKLQEMARASMPAPAEGEAAPSLPEMTADLAEQSIRAVLMQLNDVQTGTIAGLIALAAERKYPDIDADMLANEIDVDQSLEALRVIFVLNPSLRRSF